MSRRKLIFLLLASALLAAAILNWRTQGNQHDDSMALLFAGYTNQSFTGTPSEAPIAQLIATNNGKMPLKVWTMCLTGREKRQGLVIPSGDGKARVLKPGDSFRVEVSTGNNSNMWCTEIAYQRHGFAQRIYDRLPVTGNSIAGRIAYAVLASPDFVPVESGWITNQPPPIQVAAPSSIKLQ
jgi:hypothetical protein